MSGEFSLETIVIYQYDHTCLDVLLRTLSKFVASRRLTILAFGKNGCSQRGGKGKKRGRRAKDERDAVMEKKLSAGERRGETRERERRKRGIRYDEKKGGHGRCCRRKKCRWYKREEVERKSKTVRKRDERRSPQRAIQRKRGTKGGIRSGDRGEGVCFRHLKPAVGARILFSLSS